VMMQFFIAAGVLLTLSTALLLHQFYTRALSTDETILDGSAADDEASPELEAA